MQEKEIIDILNQCFPLDISNQIFEHADHQDRIDIYYIFGETTSLNMGKYYTEYAYMPPDNLLIRFMSTGEYHKCLAEYNKLS